MTHKSSSSLKLLTLALLLSLQVLSLRIHNAVSDDLHMTGARGDEGRNSHAQVDKPIYDEQRYLVDLAQKQNAFKQKVTEIQNDFAGINMMLNDTNLSQNQKTIKLSQALADERDSLITAQSKLNLPYQLKSCQCLNLTQQKKQDLSKQLQKVNTKISQLQKSSVQSNKHCESHDCPLMKQMNNEIQMMKRYQTIMENTINSKCCEVVKYAYRDNLDVTNWHWGNITQNDYQAKVYQREQSTDTKLQPCPYSQPWVKIQDNTCFACTTDKPLFNVGTRECEKDCTQFSKNPAFVLNLTTHACGYNTNCPTGQYFDETLRKCSTAISYTNQSSCPPSRPFWDPLSFSCQSCPSQTPYFDVLLKSCRKCNSNEAWNQNTRICEYSSQNCGDGYYWNSTSGKCVAQTSDTHSLCPPERPFWNEVTYSCDECSNDWSFYDPVKKLCRICTQNEVFNQYTKKCTPKSDTVTCGSDEFYNAETKSCQKRGTTSMCPPSTPYWDSVNFKCLQCPSKTPSFNEKTRQCQSCASNFQWSNKYQQCIQSCPTGEEWNQEYRKCIKTNQVCPQKYAFSFDVNKCIEINCDEKNPYWNSTVNLCQPCPAGTAYNYVIAGCEKDTRSGNVSVCHEDKPLWNPEYMRCEPCPEGKVWNSLQKACLSQSVNTNSHNHHHMASKQNHQSHVSAFKEGHVYGNEKVLYQYHDLSSLQN